MVPFVEAEAVVTSPAQSNVQRVQRVIVIYIYNEFKGRMWPVRQDFEKFVNEYAEKQQEAIDAFRSAPWIILESAILSLDLFQVLLFLPKLDVRDFQFHRFHMISHLHGLFLSPLPCCPHSRSISEFFRKFNLELSDMLHDMLQLEKSVTI